MKKIFLLLILISLQSCKIQGLTNDYKKLSISEKAKIKDLKDFENLSIDYIYKINGSQLKKELLKYDKSMVYVFTNGCTSDLCRPLMVYENYAKRHNLKLFLVMNGFANLHETFSQPFSTPLFAVDGDYYNKKYRTTYIRYFENDLLEKPIKTKEKEYLGDIFLFNNGKYEKTLFDLPKD